MIVGASDKFTSYSNRVLVGQLKNIKNKPSPSGTSFAEHLRRRIAPTEGLELNSIKNDGQSNLTCRLTLTDCHFENLVRIVKVVQLINLDRTPFWIGLSVRDFYNL